MSANFYQKLKRPIIALAPMSGVTDEAFRQMLLKFGRPDIFWTEFVSVDGLCSEGKEKLLENLRFINVEHPIVAQIFGSDPKLFEKSAKIIKKLNFDGIDINMGCPNKDIEKQGAGAMLIKNPKLAKKIIRATKKGAGSMPVSVKTRIGYSKNEIEKWIPALLEENLAALTIHFRTRNEAWKPPAHWEMAKKIVNLRNEISPNTLILGNGDVKSLTEAKNLAKKTGLDGIMIGRGIMANPWLFSMSKTEPSMPEKLKTLIKHTERFEKINKNNIDKNGKIKNFDSVKKFFKAYTSGFKGGKELRERLMKAKNAKEIKVIINDFYLKKDKN